MPNRKAKQSLSFASTAFEERRKAGWKRWWNTIGKFQKSGICVSQKIMVPARSVELAELVGILIGDGGITDYQVAISLGSVSDASYIQYVVKLIMNVCGLTPGVVKVKNANCVNIVISRKRYVEYFVELGLKKGDKLKQGLDMPAWIQVNPQYLAACIRGIMDTDGCIFAEEHHYKNRTYRYPRLSIVSFSPKLRKSLCKALRSLGLQSKIRGDRSVNLERFEDIHHYFQIIGTSNPKHLERWSEWRGRIAV